jgi:hypothetical protein
MTTEPSPAERFNANLGLTNPTGGSGAGAPPQATGEVHGDREYATAWGTTRDPAQAWAALQSNPDYMRALMDGGSPAHKEAVAKRSELFQAIHGDERADIPQGSAYGEVADGVVQMPEEVTAEQMQAAHVNTAAEIIERAGIFDPDTGRRVDPETAKNIAQAAVGAGLSTLDISDVAQTIAGGREYASPEAALASLGDNSGEVVRRAQAEAHRLQLPQELLDMPVGEHLVLGEHPHFVQWLAKRTR